jgi:hypothetical protein
MWMVPMWRASYLSGVWHSGTGLKWTAYPVHLGWRRSVSPGLLVSKERSGSSAGPIDLSRRTTPIVLLLAIS